MAGIKLVSDFITSSCQVAGRAIAQVVSCLRATVEARVCVQFCRRGIFDGQSDNGISFSLSPSVSPVNIISPWLFILILICHLQDDL
jgi:hypothetical protein